MNIRSITIAIDFDTVDTYNEIIEKLNGFIIVSDYDKTVTRGDEITINIMPGSNIGDLLKRLDEIMTEYDYLFPRLLFKEELDARDL